MRLSPMGIETLWVALLLGLASPSPVSRSLAPAAVDCGCTTGDNSPTTVPFTVPESYGSPDRTISSTPTISTPLSNDTTTALSSSSQDGAVIPFIPPVPGSSTTSPVPTSTLPSPTASLTSTATTSLTLSHQTFGAGGTASNATGFVSPASTSTEPPTTLQPTTASSSILSSSGGIGTSHASASQSSDTTSAAVAGILPSLTSSTSHSSSASSRSAFLSTASSITGIHPSMSFAAQPSTTSPIASSPATGSGSAAIASSTDLTTQSSTGASSSGSMPTGVGLNTETSTTVSLATSASGSALTDSNASFIATATTAIAGTSTETGTAASAVTTVSVATTATTGTAYLMSQAPSATASPSAEPDDDDAFHGFLVPLMFVGIDNQTYTGLTSDSDPLDIILSDGTFATITERSITVNGETAQLPEPANLTPGGAILFVNGWQVTVTEAEYRNAYFDPKTHDGLDLFTFFSNAITKVSAAADSAVNGISKIAGTIMGDALAASATALAGTPGVALDGFELTGSAARAALASGGQALDDFAMSVEMMDLSLNMVNTELANGELDPRIYRTGRVFNSIKPSALRTILNEVKNLKQIIKILAEGAQDVAPKVVTALRGKYKQQVIIGTGGIFSMYIVQLYTTRDTFPPFPPPVNSTGPVKKPFNDTEWKWFAQTDLPIPLFHLFTKLLDGDQGIKSNAVLGIHTTGPTYYTTMKDSQAMLLQGFPMIAYMDRMMTWDEHIEYTKTYIDFGDATHDYTPPADEPFPSEYQDHGDRHDEVRPRGLISGSLVWPHQAAMSLQKRHTYAGESGATPYTYTRDESDGDGATIFILDSGIDVSTPGLQTEFRTAGKNPDDWIFKLPDALTVPDPDLSPPGLTVCPEDFGDAYYNPWSPDGSDAPRGHGTPVAALAGGLRFGIAPMADLYSIKTTQCGWKLDAQGKRQTQQLGATPRALRAATDQVEKIVKQRNLQGKAVINISWTKTTAREGFALHSHLYLDAMKHEDEYKRLMRMCARNGIIIVSAAGNNGYWPIKTPTDDEMRLFAGATYPSRWSSPDNEIIVVGGATSDGRLWTGSTQRGIYKLRGTQAPVVIQDPNDPRLASYDFVGNIDIYAMARNVDSPIIGDRVRQVSGTSFAAPQVAGLVAYLLMKPDTRQDWIWDEQRNNAKLWGARMKETLRDLSWQHVKDEDIIPLNARPYPWEIPRVNYAYNGAYGLQEGLPWPTATSTATATPTATAATMSTIATAPEATSLLSTSEALVPSSVGTSLFSPIPSDTTPITTSQATATASTSSSASTTSSLPAPTTSTSSKATPPTISTSTTTVATVTIHPSPTVVLAYDFISTRQIWNDGTELCYWAGASSDTRVTKRPFICDMRVPSWDYTTADAGPQCDGLNVYGITQKWYNTDAWGRCLYEKVSDDTLTPGVIIGKLTGCDKPGAPTEVSCTRSWEVTSICPAEVVPYGRRTIATPVVECKQKFY